MSKTRKGRGLSQGKFYFVPGVTRRPFEWVGNRGDLRLSRVVRLSRREKRRQAYRWISVETQKSPYFIVKDVVSLRSPMDISRDLPRELQEEWTRRLSRNHHHPTLWKGRRRGIRSTRTTSSLTYTTWLRPFWLKYQKIVRNGHTRSWNATSVTSWTADNMTRIRKPRLNWSF